MDTYAVKEIVNYTDVANALTRVVKTALRKKHDLLAKTYRSYLRIIENEKNPDTFVRSLSRKLIPNDDVYNQRLEKYRNKYFDNNNNIYTSLENLYKIYYNIAQEENRERSEEEVERMFNEI